MGSCWRPTNCYARALKSISLSALCGFAILPLPAAAQQQRSFVSPGDESWALQWNLNSAIAGINIESGWSLIPQQGAGVTVAVIDDGSGKVSPDMDGQWLPGYDFFDNDSETTTSFGFGCDDASAFWHGVAVSSVIAAKVGAGTDSGIAGIAPNAKILPIRVYWACGSDHEIVSTKTLAEAIRWAAGLGSPYANAVNPTPAKVISRTCEFQFPTSTKPQR